MFLAYVFRERDFYAEKGVPCPKDLQVETEKDEKLKKEEEDQTPDGTANVDYHRSVGFKRPGEISRIKMFIKKNKSYYMNFIHKNTNCMHL